MDGFPLIWIPQKKFRMHRSSSSISLAGSLQYCITYNGVALVTTCISIIRAARDRSLIFQPPSLLQMLSTRYWKCWLCRWPWKKGIPRYLPNSVVTRIVNWHVMALASLPDVFGVNQIQDLAKFTRWPDNPQKDYKVSRIECAWRTVASPNSNKSSVKKMWEITKLPRLALHAFHSPESTFLQI